MLPTTNRPIRRIVALFRRESAVSITISFSVLLTLDAKLCCPLDFLHDRRDPSLYLYRSFHVTAARVILADSPSERRRPGQDACASLCPCAGHTIVVNILPRCDPSSSTTKVLLVTNPLAIDVAPAYRRWDRLHFL